MTLYCTKVTLTIEPPSLNPSSSPPTERSLHDLRRRTRKRLHHRILHAELDIMQLLQAEPLPVDRNAEIAQVNSVLGAGHLLLIGGGRRVDDAALRHLHHFHGGASLSNATRLDSGIADRGIDEARFGAVRRKGWITWNWMAWWVRGEL